MATSKFKQEMPPAGGYSPLDWAKKIPKRMNGKCVMGAKRNSLICHYFRRLQAFCPYPTGRRYLELLQGGLIKY